MPNSENVGRNDNAPWWSSAIVLYIGVALMIIGALLMFYLEGTFRFILGGALILLGALSPIVTIFIFGKKG
ncbi:MAG: hypothetical protein M3209_04100 [Acidobacteriota bacterium]|nr:hypothetical protein [Acidobacteriota bacterium]